MFSHLRKFSIFMICLLVIQMVMPVMQVIAEGNVPTNVRATVIEPGDYRLQWTAVSGASAHRAYDISNGQKELVGETRYNVVNVYDLEEGNSYTFAVSAVVNGVESELSEPVTVTVTYPEMQPPANLRATVTDGNVNLTWSPSQYGEKYAIYREVNGNDVLITETVNNEYVVKGLSEGEKVFKVKSYNSRYGYSANASRVTAVVEHPEIQTPTLVLDSAANDRAQLSWSSNKYADSYKLYEVIDNDLFVIETTSRSTSELLNLEPGRHEYKVRAISSQFGESELSNSVFVEVAEDFTKPNTTTNTTSGWTNKDVDVNLTATDDKSGVEKTVYILEDGQEVEGTSFKITKQGTTSYSYYSVDKAGNKESTKTTTVRIDKEMPVTISNADDQTHESFKLSFNSTDNLSGVYATFYSLDGENYRAGDFVNLTENGTHQVLFYAVDQAGNKGDVQTVQVKIQNTNESNNELPYLSNLGFNKSELEQLMEYIGDNASTIEQLAQLESKYDFLNEWTENSKLESTQLEELESFLNEFKEISGVDVIISVSNEEISLENLSSIDVTRGSDINVHFNSPSGTRIAEMTFPTVGIAASNPIKVDEPSSAPIETPVAPKGEKATQVEAARSNERPVTLEQKKDKSSGTVDGGELPKTASNMTMNILLGLIIMLIGAWLMMKNFKRKTDAFQK